MAHTPTDDLLATIVDITMTPTQLRSAEQVQDEVQDRPIVIRTCPVCRSPHPADVACKPLERLDNGPTLERR